jgi:hypothetical protein
MSLLQRVQQYLSGVNRTLRSIKITVGDHERRLLAVEAHTATGTGGLGVTHDTFLAVVQSQLDELATVRAVSGDPNNSDPPSYPPAYELPDIAGVWAGADTYANGDVVTVMQTGIKARPYAIVKGGGGGGVRLAQIASGSGTNYRVSVYSGAVINENVYIDVGVDLAAGVKVGVMAERVNVGAGVYNYWGWVLDWYNASYKCGT